MKTKKLVLSGFFIACGLALPMAFHMFNMGGPVFLPMHIPVLITGYFLGTMYGAAIGIVTPIISGLLTGMPPLIPVMPIMVFELCGYGLFTGLIFYKTNNIYLSLISAMVAGRLLAIVGALVVSLTLAPKVNPIAYVVGGLFTAIPGMIIQLIFIPMLIKLLFKNKEISRIIA